MTFSGHHDPAAGSGTVPLTVILFILLAYAAAAYRQRRLARPWSGWRSASFLFGGLMLIAAIVPPVANFAHHDLRGHMVQHLLLGMFAPLGLVLAAPVTLALRTLPVQISRQLVVVLHSQPVQALSHPVSAFILSVGGMYLLYLTPLFAATQTSPALHLWVHLHFVIAGCLFTWAIAGPDPGLHRPGPRYRFVVLFVSMATHAILAKTMYAYGWPRGTGHSLEQIQAAAQLMYYGGDIAELGLVIALLTIWYRTSGRALRRQQRLNTFRQSA